MDRRLLLIVNPYSGKKKGSKKLSGILQTLQDGGNRCTVMLTDKRMAASEFASEFGKDHDVIACIGGDGTFNETVNGMLHADLTIPLGYIPTGSTNDFAASLHLPTKINKAAKTITTLATRKLDIGLFGKRNFSYVASFGAFTKTSYSTSQSFKNVFGHFAYLLAGMKDVWSIRSQHLCFEFNGKKLEGDYIFGAISNSTSLGGVLTIPHDMVDMNDGLFEILLVRRPHGIGELLKISSALIRKKFDKCDLITFESTPSVTVTSAKPIDWSLDGEKETIEGTFEVRCLHDALNVITGETASSDK